MVKPEQKWSWSRVKLWDQCQLAWYLRYVMEIPDTRPPHRAVARGLWAHVTLEQYVRHCAQDGGGDTKHIDVRMRELPQGLGTWIDSLVEAGISTPEEELCYSDPATGDRVKYTPDLYGVDVTGVPGVESSAFPSCVVVDWKTGKRRPDHTQQVELYASLLAEARHENIVGIVAYIGETDLFDPARHVMMGRFLSYERAQANVQRFLGQTRSISAHVNANKPLRFGTGPLCRFCPYAESNGGSCNTRNSHGYW